ncbi:hypothetical protein B0A48_14929 [Cryoendolithus antarcticus]|uniref:Uncharacterized protein n=1 Tax=Cryoendolithus antarcticus TaxID=1507870 RepID=A0A1V8SIW2_9PEZI|nr:hypothetical protein B0A48_14929 [Cryoendolithus antarcticus]
MSSSAVPGPEALTSRVMDLSTELSLEIFTRVVHDLVPTRDEIFHKSDKRTRRLVSRYLDMPLLRSWYQLRTEAAEHVGVALQQVFPALKQDGAELYGSASAADC